MSLSRAVARLGYPTCSPARHAYRLPTSSRAASTLRVQKEQRQLSTAKHDPSLSYVPDVNVIVDKIRQYIPTANVGALHQQFHGLFRMLRETGKYTPPLKEGEIHDALSILAMSGRHHDLDMVVKILTDLPMLCGAEVGVTEYNVVLRGLIKNGNPQTIFNWLINMPQKPRNMTPTLLQWHMFFEWCAETGLLKMLQHSISKMHRSGRRPSIKTFEILFKALFDTGAPIKKYYDALDVMEQTTLTYDENFANLLYDGFVKLGFVDRAQEMKDVYWRRFSERSRTTDPKMIEWTERIEKEAEGRGITAAVTLCRSLQRDGFKPVPHSLTLLIRHTHRLDHLRYAEAELNLKATVVQWAILINNAVRVGDLSGALSIYEESKAAGVVPGVPLVHPLVNALCTGSNNIDDAVIDRALELYKDLVEAAPISQSQQMPKPSGRRHSSGPDANLYNILFRAFGASRNVKKYFPIALSLLQDMEARNVELESPMAVSALVIVIMRCSSSFDDALKAYKRICKRPNAPSLDAKGYQAILNTLTQLSFGSDETLPSVWHYFEIVKDMRMAGIEVTAPVYTILLRHLALLSADLPSDECDSIAAAVRRVHDHLTLDPSFTPDTMLWNQLMDSYQRVGLFAEAYRIWEMLLITERFNHASVAIIIDACGFARSWPMAAQVCLKLSKIGFKFNQRTWNAWVECMCRVGKLDDALKVVCLEMGKDQANVAPDVNTVKVLLSFAARTNQQDEVMDRIKRYLPQLWHTLPDELDGYFIRARTTGADS